ncbi:MAG: S8/S53 family peptidase [Pseudomonadota bacterium]
MGNSDAVGSADRAAIRSIQGRSNVDPDIVERLTVGDASVDVEVVVKAYDVNPLFYRPVVDDTAAMRRRAMARLREGLTLGLRERFNPTAAQMDRGVFRGRFGAVDIDALSRSGFVHGVAAVRSGFVQATAAMPQIISKIGVTTLHAQGLLGTGQRIALIDRRFYPQIMGAALVWEECFCATQCCPNGTARQSGPGSSFTAGTVGGPDHGTQTASVIAMPIGQGVAPTAGVVALAAPEPVDVFAALEWLQSRPDVGIVSLSIGDAGTSGVCDGSASAASWLPRVSTLAAQGKLVFAAAGNGGSNTTLVPACLSPVHAVAGTWICDGNFQGSSGGCLPEAQFDAIWAGSNRSPKVAYFAPARPLQVPFMGDTQGGFAAGTSYSTPMVAACAALLKQARPAATAAQIANALSQSPTQVIFPGAGGAEKKANIQRPRIDCAVALAALPPAATGPSLNQHGISGFWYNPSSNGQGFAVEVYPNLIAPNVGLMAGSWYTFAPAPAGGPERQRWYTFDGAAATGSATAQLTVRRNIDGNFAQPPTTTAAAVGTATLTMTSCTTATLSDALNDGSGSGSMPLTRLAPNVSCTTSGTGGSFHPDFALSGFFNDPNLNGQGIFLEFNPNLPVLAAGWYSYTRASIPGGTPRQRWYTLQLGPYTVGTRSFSGVPILATTGGTFNGQPSTATTQVGSAHLQLLGCGGASLSYAFTAGENAGLSGNIALARTGPAPPGCQ